MKHQTLTLMVIVSLFALALHGVITSEICNSNVCASIVSKCQLQEKCDCEDRHNATCSKECFKCLDYLYLECCHCVKICPQINDTDSVLSKTSHVEELPEAQPSLFEILTEEEDPLQRWTSHSFAVKVSFVTTTGDESKDLHLGAGTKVTFKGDAIDQEEDVQANCTVVYMADCMSTNKCKSSCASMGASSYRWFLDGCCECVGSNCVNYGLNESKCLECPLKNHREEETDNQHNTNPANSRRSFESMDYEVAPSASDDELMPDKKVDQEELDKIAKATATETTAQPEKKD